SSERTRMNEQERSELSWLKRRQQRLEQELRLLSQQLEALESRLSWPEPAAPKAAEPTPGTGLRPSEFSRKEPQPAPQPVTPPPIPPLIPPVIPPAPVIASSSVQPHLAATEVQIRPSTIE